MQATNCNVSPAISLFTPGLNDKYLTIVVSPRPDEIDMMAVNLFLVKNYYYKNYLNLPLYDLRRKGSEIKIEYSLDDIRYIERFRVGHITATQFLNTCRTPVSKPSISAINSTCWPEIPCPRQLLPNTVAAVISLNHVSFSVKCEGL